MTVRKTKKQRTYSDELNYSDWVAMTVNISPAVFDRAMAFAKEHDMFFSQLINSAVKVFIFEAEDYVSDQRKWKDSFFTSNEMFRMNARFTTEDACKELKVPNNIKDRAKEQLDWNEKRMKKEYKNKKM